MLSIRNVLCSVIGLMAVAITALVGIAAFQASQRNSAARSVAELSRIERDAPMPRSARLQTVVEAVASTLEADMRWFDGSRHT